VFNLADSSIVVGLILLAWLFLRPGGVAGRSPAASAPPEVAPVPPVSTGPAPGPATVDKLPGEKPG
jgi:hypothetical protein